MPNYIYSIIWIVIWVISFNSYFGWNWIPKSDAELICDGLTVLMVIITIMMKKC